jgi:isopenicillin-N epimerase
MAAVALPDLGSQEALAPPLFLDPVQAKLRARFNIEVPVIPWPASPKRLLRISAQLYNTPAQFEALAAALTQLMLEA